jgi:chromate transporter
MLDGLADDACVHPALDVFARFARLGVTSFGGPVAHLGYFRREFVERAAWLDDEAYGEIVALCSVLPGPTSSQVGIALGARRAGPLGALLAWVGFTLPSAAVMAALGVAFNAARGAGAGAGALAAASLRGPFLALQGVAAAVVLAAVLAMAKSLLTSRFAYAVAAASFAAALALDARAPGFAWTILVAAGIAGAIAAPPAAALPSGSAFGRVPRAAGIGAAVLFVFGIAVLPALAGANEEAALFATCFRAGSLVFGGGHVVLPFLQTLVASGRVDSDRFLAGYGLVQAVPGPLFTFAAFLGAADVRLAHAPLAGAAAALAGIFAPSFLLLAMVAPLWGRLRALPRAARVIGALGAAVVGLLAAVFVTPVASSIATAPVALAIAVLAFALLRVARWPSWAVVLAGAAAGALAQAARIPGAG